MFHLRPAQDTDLPALLALEKASFPHDPWGETALRVALREGGYLTLLAEAEVEDSHRVVGYVIGWHVLDEADLARLGVAPEQRRHGLGRCLLQAALARWTQDRVRRVFLDVRAGNVAALGLYASLGFERVGYRKQYYPDGEDAVLMALEIDSGEVQLP